MDDQPLEVLLLGPVECRAEGQALEIGSRTQRILLAMLALQAPRVASRELLIDGLWGDAPPPSAPNSLEAHISRLRGASPALAEALKTKAPGYVLDAATDLQRFETLRCSEEAANLESALNLWRGPALADVDDAPFAELEAPRLEELRLLVTEELLRARLASGQQREVVPDLEALVAEHPLREGLRELLMLALYRSGRQADALEVYRDAQARLRNELGLEPSPRLRELERAILRHDLTLTPSGEGDPEKAAPPRRGRKGPLAVAALALLGAAVAAVAVLTSESTAHGTPTKPVPLGNHVLAEISVPLPSCCAFGFGSVWAVGHHNGLLYRIDPQTNRVVETFPVAGFQAQAPMAGVGSIWIPAGAGDLVRFDPVTRRVVARFHVNTANIGWGYGNVWVTTRDHRLLRIDYGNNTIAAQLRLAPGVNDFNDGLVVADGAVWVTVTDRAELLRIDPVTMKVVARVEGFGSTYSWMPVAFGDGSIWIYRVLGARGVVYRVDPRTNRIIKRISTGLRDVAWPNGNTIDEGGYVWSCDAGNTLTQISPASNRVIGWYSLPDEVCSEVVNGYQSLWMSFYDHSLIYRISP